MNEERGQFTFYRSFWDAMNQLPQREQLPFVKALCAYAFTGEEANLRGGAAASFLLVKPILDKASKKAANGKKGGSKPKAKMKQTENYKEGELEKEIEKEIEVEIEIEGDSPITRAKRFTPPTIADVEAYCRERGNNVDAQHFVDFYASKGWKVGNQPMKDWKASVRTWEQRDKTAIRPQVQEGRLDWIDGIEL